jgi:type I restriction enzyme S subunit
MAVKKRYKQTEAGVIPEDWKVRPIREISNPVRGGSPRPAGDPRFFDGNFIPWLTVAALTNIPSSQLKVSHTDSCLTEEGSLRSRILYPGTLILANSGATLGVAKILGIKCCANDGIAALLNFNATVSTTYLVHYINTRTQYLRDVVATGNGQPNLNTDLIGNFKIPLPPTLAEQEAIAGALSDADAWIESLEQLIAKKRQIKQGAMQELLTGKRRLPGFSGEWEETTLGELATFLSGGTPSRNNDGFWTGDIPWISASSLRCFEIWRSDSNVTKEAVVSGSKIAPVGSSLLLVRGSALHKEILCGLVIKPVCFNQDVKALVPYSQVVPRFLTMLIRGMADAMLKLVSSAGNTAGVLDTKLLKAFAIRLPTPNEQTAIATVLLDMDTEIGSLESKLVKAREIKQGMMQELLTGKIRLV